MASRARPVPTVAAPKPPPPPPKGKGSPLWHSLYADAQLLGHPEPERWADSALRQRERTLEVQSKKHTLKVLGPSEIPKAPGAPAPTAAALAARCAAKTLEGKPCAFKATCGAFCKKHSTNNLKLV
jgi:hypothetical protein